MNMLWRGRNDEEWFFYIIFILLGEGYRGGGQTWRDWEMSGIELVDVKFPKNQYNKLCFKERNGPVNSQTNFFCYNSLLLIDSGRRAIIAFTWIPLVTLVGSNGQFQSNAHTDGPGWITWVTKQTQKSWPCERDWWRLGGVDKDRSKTRELERKKIIRIHYNMYDLSNDKNRKEN